MNVEIEIKVKVKDFKKIKKILRAKKAKFIKKIQQVDEYYTPFHRDFFRLERPIEWLRIRSNENKARFEYDHTVNIDTKKEEVHEYEINISDSRTMKEILDFLDFKKRYIVDKEREYWRFGKFEFCLDKVKKLGNFLEVELISDKKGKNFDYLYKFIDSLGFKYKKLNYRSYINLGREKLKVN